MRCDVIAQGVLAAAKNIGLEKPIVIRLQGTNVDIAKKLISESDVEMTMLDDLVCFFRLRFTIQLLTASFLLVG